MREGLISKLSWTTQSMKSDKTFLSVAIILWKVGLLTDRNTPTMVFETQTESVFIVCDTWGTDISEMHVHLIPQLLWDHTVWLWRGSSRHRLAAIYVLLSLPQLYTIIYVLQSFTPFYFLRKKMMQPKQNTYLNRVEQRQKNKTTHDHCDTSLG